MAEDHGDGDYLSAYSRFFADFAAWPTPYYDAFQPSKVLYYVSDAEVVGEIVSVAFQFLKQTNCPSSLLYHLVHQVIQEVKPLCKKKPQNFDYSPFEKAYSFMRLIECIILKVNEICSSYLNNSRLALLPPPSYVPLQVIVGSSKNRRRTMEDRYVVMHDLHTMFGIQDDSIAHYYAVFDGHAGQDAAVYCATHIHQYLAESCYYPSDPERALHDAFVTTDARFIEKSKRQVMSGGTTAVCTLLLNKKLYVAWVGDSTAILIKRDSVVQLVSPHRLNREDEVERVLNMGGVVIQTMGVMRVHGVLSVSRAIGDVRFKPFVTGEPEVKCVPLDGTEDFLVIASDGLTDYLEPDKIRTLLYKEVQENPNNLVSGSQVLLKAAKYAGSEDNITVLVVLLTPAEEIAARTVRGVQVDDKLEKMNSKDKPLLLDIDDPHNSINSSILKQTMINDQSRDDEDGILAPSNGKHENGDADYDYSDLGPETDVDAVDDVAAMPVKNLSYEFYKDEYEDNKDLAGKGSDTEDHVTNNDHKSQNDGNLLGDNEVDDEERNDEVETPETIRLEDVKEKVNETAMEQIDEDNEGAKLFEDDRADGSEDVVDDAAPVNFSDSPPSPQANKPLQHALIPEADNVADSEDSEDEWNYYRVSPNKEKDSVNVPTEEARNETEQERKSPELLVELDDPKIQSQDLLGDIKCESPKELLSSEFIDTEISAENGGADHTPEHHPIPEEQDNLKEMEFRLNPDAAEFVPVSPFISNRMNLTEDYPISGSPLKPVSQMDDIQVPSQSEFDEEVCRRPREVEAEEKEEYQNGEDVQHTDYTEFTAERQKALGLQANLDDSEISSTKAEFGDESSSFLTASEFHRTGITTADESFSSSEISSTKAEFGDESSSFLTASKFHRTTGITTVDESFSNSEKDYDIAKDPMAMSLTPIDFEAAFDKPVDLNAVHDLTNTDLEEKNGNLENEEVRAMSPQPELMLNISENVTRGESTEKAIPAQPWYAEDRDATSMERVEEPKTVDLLNLQSEPLEVQQVRFDHSPLTENYSGEFESENEAVSSLSPSIVDVGETKLPEEASEHIQSPEVDSQKEECAKEADIISAVSPVPGNVDTHLEGNVVEKVVENVEEEQITENVEEKFTENVEEKFTENVEEKFIGNIEEKFTEDVEEKITEDVEEKLADIVEEKIPEHVEEKIPEHVEEKIPEHVEEEQIADIVEEKTPENLEEKIPESIEEKIPENVEEKIQETIQEPEEPVQSLLHPDAPEFTPVQYNYSFGTNANEVDEANDVCKLPTTPAEAPVSYLVEKEVVHPAEVEDSNIPEDQNLTAEPRKEIPEPVSSQENIVDFAAELLVLSEVTKKVESEPSPLVSAQKPEEKVPEPMEDLVCPVSFTSKVEHEEIEKDVMVDLEEEKPKELKEPLLNLSDSMQEFRGFENELNPTVEETPVSSIMKEKSQQEVLQVQESVEPEKLVEEVPKPVEDEIVKVEAKVEAALPEVQEPKEEKVPEAPETKVSEIAVAAIAVTAVSAVGAAAKAKAKPGVTKTTKAPTTKAPTKSTPTSPSKAATTKPAATKKPLTSSTTRSKELEASKKPPVHCTTAAKAPATKLPPKTTSAAKPAPKPLTSATSKPKPAASSLKSVVADKKPTTNGDLKSLTKPAAAKPLNKPATTLKSTLTKSSATTRTSSSTATTLKHKSAAATLTATSKPATRPTSTGTTTTARPKTAPPASTGPTMRSRSVTSTLAKSPLIDKQVKETANKQISMSRTSTTSSKTAASRGSTASTTLKRVSGTTKSAANAASPTKKALKGTGRTSATGKISEKPKVLQNGVSEKIEINNVIEDVPMKDLSPVVGPNDNQLIVTTD